MREMRPYRRERRCPQPDGRRTDRRSLDQAVAAINRGDRAAGDGTGRNRYSAADGANAEAEDLLAAPADPGEIAGMAIFFADLVDSTALSTRLEPETYRMLVGRYREQVRSTVDRLEGHHRLTPGRRTARRSSGHLTAHEDDVRRAVLAVLEITREVARLNEQAERRFGLGISVRVGVHRGLVYWTGPTATCTGWPST